MEIRITPDPLSRKVPIVVRKDHVDEVSLSNVSAMPAGLLDRLEKQQILDLLAYIESRGDPHHGVYTTSDSKKPR